MFGIEAIVLVIFLIAWVVRQSNGGPPPRGKRQRAIQPWVQRGYIPMTVRAGYLEGTSVPPGETMLLRIAPEEIAGCVIAWGVLSGGKPDLTYADGIEYASASSNGRQFWGFGVEGMIAAQAMTAWNKNRAGWDLELRFTGGGRLSLTADSGPLPQSALTRMSARLDGAA